MIKSFFLLTFVCMIGVESWVLWFPFPNKEYFLNCIQKQLGDMEFLKTVANQQQHKWKMNNLTFAIPNAKNDYNRIANEASRMKATVKWYFDQVLYVFPPLPEAGDVNRTLETYQRVYQRVKQLVENIQSTQMIPVKFLEVMWSVLYAT